MKNILPAFLLLLSLQAWGQYKPDNRYLEIGFLLGAASYSGDVAEARLETKEIQPGYGMFVRYHFNNKFSLKGHLYSGAISGDDKNSKTLAARKFRFGTSYFEAAGVAEWNFFSKDRISNVGEHQFQLVPYIYLGAGMTFIDPDAEYYGAPEDRDEYLKISFPEEGLKKRLPLFPVGLGLRVDAFDRLIFGMEAGLRPTFSDSLDGVRVNGNPDKNDWYYFLGATAAFILTNPNKHEF